MGNSSKLFLSMSEVKKKMEILGANHIYLKQFYIFNKPHYCFFNVYRHWLFSLRIFLSTYITIHFHFPVTDELIKEVQIGCYSSFVVLPSCEIHESSLHFQCTPVFEVRCWKFCVVLLLIIWFFGCLIITSFILSMGLWINFIFLGKYGTLYLDMYILSFDKFELKKVSQFLFDWIIWLRSKASSL